MLRIGLLGCGEVAGYGHLPAIAETKGIELAAVYDPDPRQLDRHRALLGSAPAGTDLEAFFAAGLEAVSVVSPAACHHANVLAAAARGLHVLCEKPLALAEPEMEEMRRACRASGVQLYTAFDYRFSHVAQALREVVRSREIGAVKLVRLVYIWNLHGKWMPDAAGKPVDNARRSARMAEGGPLVDCGVHQIDLARWWLGSEIVDFEAQGAWIDGYETPDHVWLHARHACGALTVVELSYSYCHTARDPIATFTYELIGTAGVARYDREARTFEVRSASDTRRPGFSPEKNFAGMYAAFARAVATGDPGDLATADDGITASRIARRATQAVIDRRARSTDGS